MPLISHSQFSRLRLRRFLPSRLRVVEQDGFEWMNGLWLYEGLGFTWFGRLETAPDATAGVELFFEELPRPVAKRILYRIGLPICPGMKLRDISGALGKPQDTQVFCDDRKTYVFALGGRRGYEVCCTAHQKDGLIHVSIIRADVRRRLAVAARRALVTPHQPAAQRGR
jgi:hypothetical protein